MTDGYKPKTEAELLLEEIDALDPFADKRTAEELASPAPTEERAAPKTFRPISEDEVKEEFSESDQMWWVVRKVGTPMSMRDRETGEMKEIFAAWKPRVAEEDCCGSGQNGKNNAFKRALEQASEVIRCGKPQMKLETISFDVVGPLTKFQIPSTQDAKLALKGLSRTLADSNIHAIVSTRVFNRDPGHKDFLKPQVTTVARGKSGMSEINFAARFPGGRIPMEEIREFTKRAAQKVLPPPPTDDSDPEYKRLYHQVMSAAPEQLRTLPQTMDERLAQEN